MENNNYIKKWLEGTLTESEKKEFETSSEFKSLEKLLKSAKAFKAPEYDKEAELSKLLEKKPRKGKHVQIPWMQTMVRVAAVLLVLLSVTFYLYLNKTTSINTLAAEKSSIYLPDSSLVTLNANTTVAYKENRWKNDRSLKLDGEAFFDVSPGSRFDVETQSGIVTVLGTSFNVKNRPNFFEVICFEGLVQVQSGEELSRLEPGNAIRVLNGKVENLSGISAVAPAWLEDESSFRSVPFNQVLWEFERQYNVDISFSGIDTSKLFTGKFPHNNRSLALQAITGPFNLKFEIADEKQIILSK